MTKYYATAFKTGAYPDITKDTIYAWARTHPKDANAPDPVGKPDNFDLVRPLLSFRALLSHTNTSPLSVG